MNEYRLTSKEIDKYEQLNISNLEYVKQHNDIILTKNTHTSLQEKALFKIQEIVTSALIAHEAKLDNEIQFNSELRDSIFITTDNKKVYRDTVIIKDEYKEVMISPLISAQRIYNEVSLTWTCDNFSKELNKIVKRKLSSSEVLKLMIDMQNIQVQVPSPIKKGDYITTSWFVLHTNNSDKIIKLEIDKYLSERLIDTRNTYTKLVTNSFYNLNRASSLKLFKLLCLWIKTKNTVTYTIKYLVEYLIGDNSKVGYSKFCSKYIAESVNEINQNTHIYVTYKVVPKDRKLYEIIFDVNEKDKNIVDNNDENTCVDTLEMRDFKSFIEFNAGMKISDKLTKKVYDDLFKYKEQLEKEQSKVKLTMDKLKEYCSEKGINYKIISVRIYPFFKKTLISLVEDKTVNYDKVEITPITKASVNNGKIQSSQVVQAIDIQESLELNKSNSKEIAFNECIDLIRQILKDETCEEGLTEVSYKTWFKDLIDTASYTESSVIFKIKSFPYSILKSKYVKQQNLIEKIVVQYMGEVDIVYNVIDL